MSKNNGPRILEEADTWVSYLRDIESYLLFSKSFIIKISVISEYILADLVSNCKVVSLIQ